MAEHPHPAWMRRIIEDVQLERPDLSSKEIRYRMWRLWQYAEQERSANG